MRKLTYIANVRLPTEKAHGIQIMNMCLSFSKAGYEVELVVPTRHTEVKGDPFGYYSIPRDFRITRIWSIDTVTKGKWGFILQTATFLLSLIRLAISRNNLFYTRDESAAWLLNLLGRKVTWESHWGKNNFFARSLIGKIPIVVITGKLKEFYLDMGQPEDKILVAHDAVNLDIFNDLPAREVLRQELGLPLDKTIISYVGKYKTGSQSKGIDMIIEPFIMAGNPDFYLLVVGPEKDEAASLEKLLINKGASPESFRIASHVPHRQAIRYMKASDVLIMLYPNIKMFSHFMSPLKLFEYMATGNVILTSDIESVREVLGDDTAYFFKADDPGDIAITMEKITREPAQAREKALKAHNKVKGYSWDQRAENIIKFLHD